MPSLRTIIHSRATLWFFVVATLAALLLGWLALPWKEWLAWFNRWIAHLGAWGVVLFALAYIVAILALVPTTPLTIAAGLAFGAWGLPLVLLVSTVGAVVAFLLARAVGRDRVLRYLRKRPKWRIVDEVVSENAWKIVALIRLSPFLTFSLQNYLLGITGVRTWPYTTASFVGIVPSTALCIYVGAAGHVMQRHPHVTVLQWVVVAVGFLLLLGITIYTAHQARDKLIEAGLTRA